MIRLKHFEIHQQYATSQSYREAERKNHGIHESAERHKILTLNKIAKTVDIRDAWYEVQNTGSQCHIGLVTQSEDISRRTDNGRKESTNHKDQFDINMLFQQHLLQSESQQRSHEDDDHGQ